MTQIEALKAAMDHIDRAIDEPNNTMSDGKALKEIMRQLKLTKAELEKVIAQQQKLTPYIIHAHGAIQRIAPSKPLTDEEIQTYRHMLDWTAEWSYIDFARAIEAAHGIKEQP